MSSVSSQITAGPLLSVAAGKEVLFQSNYNRAPFLFEHTLHTSPLFDLAHLTWVAEKMAAMPGKLYYNVGKLEIGRRWDLAADRPFSSQEALERIEFADAWLILKGLQALPEYGQLLRQFLQEVHSVSRRTFEQTTHKHNLSVIITSPGRVTPYHMDEDCNYLLQVQGSKTTYVFDGNDPEVVTGEELERFYGGDINAAEYRESNQQRATEFPLTPGTGIHIPVTFPHWVKNTGDISISASINFCFRDSTLKDIYCANRFLRRIGVMPVRAGRSRITDFAKAKVMRLARVGRSGSDVAKF